MANPLVSKTLGAVALGGNVPGGIIPKSIGAALGWKAGQSLFDEETWTGKIFSALDVPSREAEKAFGTVLQGAGSLLAPEAYGSFDEFTKNLRASYEAGGLTFEATPVTVRKLTPEEELKAAGLSIFGPVGGFYRAAKSLQFGDERATFVDYDLPTTTGGLLAIVEARRRIAAGEDPDAVRADIAARFGAPGQLRELSGRGTLDPLNFLNPGKFIKPIAKFANKFGTAGDVLSAVERAGGGGIGDITQAYRNILVNKSLGDFRRGYKASKELNLLQQWIVGKDIIRLAETGKYVRPAWWQQWRLTPQSQAIEATVQSLDRVNAVLSHLDTQSASYSDDVARYVQAMAGADLKKLPADFPDIGRLELSLQGRVTQRALAEAVQGVNDVTAAYKAVADERKLFATLAEATGNTIEEVNAKALAGDGDGLLTLAKKNGVVLPETINSQYLADTAKMFKQKGIPYTPDMLQGAVLDAVGEASGEWARAAFGVRPPGLFHKIANALKAVEGIGLLGLNFTYPIRNFLNGEVTMAARGAWGLRGIDDIVKDLNRLGLQPARLTEAFGGASDIGRLAGGSTPFDRGVAEIAKAADSNDWLTKFKTGINKVASELPTLKAAQKIERWQGARAYWEGTRQMLSQSWRAGVGFDKMPPELERRLAGIDPRLPRYVYAAIESGYNPKDIGAKLFDKQPRLLVQNYYGESAQKLGTTPEALSRMLAVEGLGDSLNDGLAALKPNAGASEVAAVFRGLREQIQNANASQIRFRVAEVAEESAARVATQGPEGVMSVFDEIESRLFETHQYHDFALAQEWDEVYRTKQFRDTVYSKMRARADKTWQDYFAFERAHYEGLAEGLKRGGIVLDKDFLPAVDARRETIANFHAAKNANLDSFFKGKYDSDEARAAAWAEVARKNDELYARLIDDLNARQEKLDKYLIATLARDASPDYAQAVKEWRDKLRQLNRADMEEVAAFRRRVVSLPPETRNLEWRKFNDQRLRNRYDILRESMEIRRKLFGVQPEPPPPNPAALDEAIARQAAPPETVVETPLAEPLPVEAVPAQQAEAALPEVPEAPSEIAPVPEAPTPPVARTPTADLLDMGALKEYGWTRGKKALLNAVNKDRRTNGLPPAASLAEVSLSEAKAAIDTRLAAKVPDKPAEAMQHIEAALAAKEAAVDLSIPPGVPEENLTRNAVRQQALATGKWTPDQVDAHLALWDARAKWWAKENGRTPADWYATHFQGIQLGGEGRGGLFQTAEAGPAFYSVLERTLEQKMPSRASPQQIEGLLRGAVKTDELKWTGFDEWLSSQQGPVTREAALDFVRQNNVKLKEVTKSDVSALEWIEDRQPDGAVTYKVANQPALGIVQTPEGKVFAPDGTGGSIEFRDVQQAKRFLSAGASSTRYGPAGQLNLTLPGGQNYREVLLTLPLEQDLYRSPHWQEPNVLAHLRLNDHLTADGRKMLFTEEIQSDWHQAGREKGYAKTPDTVPPAPFAKTWHELSFRRILREAAEKGYDEVGWTTGAQQASRYNLANFVDELRWRRDIVGRYDVVGLVDGKTIFSKTLEAGEIADSVGVDIANQITRSYDPSGVIRGEGLQVGGEGMKGFYDKILVDYANRYGRKWGVKVRKSVIEGGQTVHALEVTPAMRESVLQGQPLFQGEGLDKARKGAVQFSEDGRALIRAFESADVSTLAHETGHIFRRDLTGADAEIAARWSGATKNADGSYTWNTEAEEKFARGFEAYLREGKAPSPGLRIVFQKFKEWLTEIYKTIRTLNVNLNRDIRGVYDRLLSAEPATPQARPKPKEYQQLDVLEGAERGELRRYPYEPLSPDEARQLYQTDPTPEGLQVGDVIDTDEYGRLTVQAYDEQSRHWIVVDEKGRTIALPSVGQTTKPFVTPEAASKMGLKPSVPYAEAQNENWYTSLWPVMDELQRAAEADVVNPRPKFDGGQLDADSLEAFNTWLRQGVYNKLPENKLLAMKWGEHKRDSSLLNYSRRYQYNNYLGSAAPYEFWMTQSMMRWAMATLDRPALMANYYRIQKFLNTQVQKPGFPQRLAGRIRLPMPFLPEWMGGGIYVDPMRIGLPLDDFITPWEDEAERASNLKNRAARKLQDLLEKGEITREEFAAAQTDPLSAAYKRAEELAIAEDDRLEFDGLDFAMRVFSPHLPIQWAYQYARGTPERISPLPLTRQVKGLSAALGLGPPGGLNLEEGLRRKLELPTFDEWEDYRIDRELANMAAEGVLSPDQATAAMIERQGAAFELAQARVGQQAGYGVATGLILGTPGSFYPEGEQDLRLEAELRKAAFEAENNGDTEALERFYDKYPEFAARLALNNDPQERIKNFLVNNIWQGWNNLPSLYKRQIADQFGEEFQQAFLDRETRSYDSIDPDTLAMWARTLGRYVPGNLSGEAQAIELAPPEIAQKYDAYYQQRGQIFDWETLKATQGRYFALPETPKPPIVEEYYAAKEQLFPGIGPLLEQYGQLPKGSPRSDFIKANPIMESYFAWNDDRKADRDKRFPGIQALLDTLDTLPKNSPQSKAFLKSNPVLFDYFEWSKRNTAARNEKFPGIEELLDQLFALPDTKSQRSRMLEQYPQLKEYFDWNEAIKKQHPEIEAYQKAHQNDDRSAFLDDHPELKDYWDWRRSWLEANPDVAPYLTEGGLPASSASATGGNGTSPTAAPAASVLANPMTNRLVMAYLFEGRSLPANVNDEVQSAFAASGAGGNLDNWLMGEVMGGGQSESGYVSPSTAPDPSTRSGYVRANPELEAYFRWHDAWQADKDRRFPGIDALLDQLDTMDKDSPERKAFLRQNQVLFDYFAWSKDRTAQKNRKFPHLEELFAGLNAIPKAEGDAGAGYSDQASNNVYYNEPITVGNLGALRWQAMATDYGQKYNVPPIFILSLIQAESRGNPQAVGDGGHSVGLFQLHDQGVGSGLSVSRRHDPVLQFELMMGRIASAYQTGLKLGLSGRALAEFVGGKAEGSRPDLHYRYGDAYNALLASGVK